METVNKIRTFLEGSKTYIFAVCIGITAALEYLGVLTHETALVLYGLLGAGSFAALRAGVSKTK